MPHRAGVPSFLLAALAATGPASVAAQAVPACADRATYHALDFWVGEWSVVDSAGVRQGSSRIESILNACAIAEFWTSANGGEGRSLFWVDPASGTWKQVWVTGAALLPGGTKEKQLVERRGDGAVRFQGTVSSTDGRQWLDRTTLTPLPDGRVRQRIEISTDGGGTWQTTFDAFYVRAPARGSPDPPWPPPSRTGTLRDVRPRTAPPAARSGEPVHAPFPKGRS